jgi:hypothetical protein
MKILVTEQQLEVIRHHSDCNEVVLVWVSRDRSKHGNKKVCVPDDMWELIEEHNDKPVEEKSDLDPELRSMIITLFNDLYKWEKNKIIIRFVTGNHIGVKYNNL